MSEWGSGTLYLMLPIRVPMASASGSSGAPSPEAQAFWFGQPSQPEALPAFSDAVPGQDAGALSGTSPTAEEDRSSEPSSPRTSSPPLEGRSWSSALEPPRSWRRSAAAGGSNCPFSPELMRGTWMAARGKYRLPCSGCRDCDTEEIAACEAGGGRINKAASSRHL